MSINVIYIQCFFHCGQYNDLNNKSSPDFTDNEQAKERSKIQLPGNKNKSVIVRKCLKYHFYSSKNAKMSFPSPTIIVNLNNSTEFSVN
jgi:hypothetical protein